jgi:hypothetical protein
MDYSIHYHVWRPDTFMDFLSAARAETGIELELVDFAPCDRGKDNEFIFVFLKGIAGAPPAIPPLLGEASNEPGVGGPERNEAAPGPAKRFKRWFGGTPLGPRLRPLYRAGMRSYRAARQRLTRN